MLWDIANLLIGFAVLTLGAEALVRGSASLAIRLGLTPLVIGLTIVAFGTSAPELVVSLRASLTSQGDIAIGNVVGSNIFNIGIILGLAALIRPIHVSLPVIKFDAPIMIAVSLLSLSFFATGAISRPAGIFLFSALIGYTGGNIWLARRQATQALDKQFADGVPAQSTSLIRDILFIAVGFAFLIVGSRFLIGAAMDIARLLGISEAVIGLTVIAAGTSLPELATSITAALRRQADIAVGNVVGSNIFNLLGILGAAAMVKPLSYNQIKVLDFWIMIAFSVVLLPLLWSGRKLQRWEGGLLLGGYGAYLYVLWPSG